MIACSDESVVSVATVPGSPASSSRAGSSQETMTAVLQASAAPVQIRIRFHLEASNRLNAQQPAQWGWSMSL